MVHRPHFGKPWTGVLKVRLGGAVGLAKDTFVICYPLSLW